MQLTHSFTVPASIDEAWEALSDVEQVAGCMPGASLHSFDGENFEGQVKVRVGPMQLVYRGAGQLVERNGDTRRLGMEASGKEARGQGTARARVQASLSEHPAGTQVEVVTDLDITGKPAQFGRGAMADVGQKLLDRFADQLAAQLEAPSTDAAGSAQGDEAPSQPEAGPATDDVLDLYDVAKGAVAKRLLPVVAGLGILGALIWWLRRR
jgi:uncharacterized protein